MFLISRLGETAIKSVIEMNGQPRLPSTTPLVIVAEKTKREKTDLGLMTREKSFMGRGKSECFNASYVNCHLTGA